MTLEKPQPSEKDDQTVEGENRYTVFTKGQKRWIGFLAAFAGMFSPHSSFVYYPAIYALAHDFQTSVEAINLTITSYMIVSGIVPSILGGLADRVGRRPIYMSAANAYPSGKIMNRDYRITAEKNNFTIDRIRGDDLSKFPIEHVRIRSIWYMIVLAIGGVGVCQNDVLAENSPDSEAT
ncbi:uncharacterized protein KY384_004385 [Bacidia gigantensis]|uniref:uncharacterized protein n=1 Tax=Bacidia gigantensis TaxID=2732470 RepID=UPI001D05264C|nr:uncharacterized protein KY384_004385 [Bacidia gigantensis]KAG8531028.1 hypothetical protein KY384_004385 [Bacidia gigantensis]